MPAQLKHRTKRKIKYRATDWISAWFNGDFGIDNNNPMIDNLQKAV
jgi:hypothetical protein